jgi:DNA-binding NarL/FixJ family response regulator
MIEKVLIVDPNPARGLELARTIDEMAGVEVFADFPSARATLLADPPDLLVTNLRLHAYNGLHLVYMAASAGLPVQSIVYTDDADSGFATEVHSAGAFYETADRLLSGLSMYMEATPPS